jgi:ubiquitin-conjugating enzyme E2 variant
VIAMMPDLASPVWLIAYTWLFFFVLAAVTTNQFHVWAHRSRVPAIVRMLQRHRVILTREGHAEHHRGSFRRSYCITTGWLNTWLDRIEFFPRLERRIRDLRRSTS